MGRADLHDVSRLDGLRAPTKYAGHRGADDAQHDGALSARRVRLPQRPRAARDDRGQEAGVCGHAALRRRRAILAPAGRADARQGAWHQSRTADRTSQRRPGRAAVVLRWPHQLVRARHCLSVGHRSQREHRVADPEHLRRVRHSHRPARRRLRAPQSRRAVHARGRTPEPGRASQAAAAYDHPGLHAARRHAHRLRDHGRLQPGAGARAVRGEHRRLRDGHSAGARGGTVHEGHVHRRRREHRGARAGAGEERADRARPRSDRGAAKNENVRARPGGDERRNRRALRRVGAAARRRRDPRSTRHFRFQKADFRF